MRTADAVSRRKLTAILLREQGLTFAQIAYLLGIKEYRQRNINAPGWIEKQTDTKALRKFQGVQGRLV